MSMVPFSAVAQSEIDMDKNINNITIVFFISILSPLKGKLSSSLPCISVSDTEIYLLHYFACAGNFKILIQNCAEKRLFNINLENSRK